MQVLLPVPAAHQCRGWRATSGGRARGALAHRAPAHQRSDCWRRRGASALMDAQQQHQQQHEQEQLPSWLQDMDAAFLTSALGAPIVSFTISNARELEQSDCCVVHATDDAGRTTPLLLKRYNLPRLRKREQKPDSKWRISAASFANEHCFLSARGVLAELHAFLQPHAGVPRVHLAQRRHDSSSADVLDSKVRFLDSPSSMWHTVCSTGREQPRPSTAPHEGRLLHAACAQRLRSSTSCLSCWSPSASPRAASWTRARPGRRLPCWRASTPFSGSRARARRVGQPAGKRTRSGTRSGGACSRVGAGGARRCVLASSECHGRTAVAPRLPRRSG